MAFSSPSSVLLYERESEVEGEFDGVFTSSDDDSFIKTSLNFDSQINSKLTQPPTLITLSQIDPLYEFSQVPEEEEEEINDDDEDEDENYLMDGPVFNTQMTDLKDEDEEFYAEEINTSRHLEDPFHYGTDGYTRYKIPEISSSTDPKTILNLIQKSKKIVLVSGAGISVSAGIPDFRSEGKGLYALLDSFLCGNGSEEANLFFGGLKGWQLEALKRLDEPESLFDLEYFIHDPHPFYSFLLATRFGSPSSPRFSPTPSHYVLESLPNLLLSFTQNIDTLESIAGLHQVCYCHGSFEGVSCIKCHRPHDLEYFWKLLDLYADSDNYASFLPTCQYCSNESEDSDDEDYRSDDSLPLLKPDIVFFGESLPANFFAHIRSTLPSCDLLIVTGSSMKVLPVGSIPDLIPPTIPQILINKEPILDHNFDLEIIGEADLIWSWIGKELNLLKCQDKIKKEKVEIIPQGNGKFIFKLSC